MKKKGLSILLVLLLAMCTLPAGTASAAENTVTESIVYQGGSVGAATLSLNGTTLSFQANIGASNVNMSSLRLTLGSTVAIDAAALSGSEQRNFARTIENVQYASMKEYKLEIGLQGAGSAGELETKTFVSRPGFPNTAVAETFKYKSIKAPWYDLAWNPETRGVVDAQIKTAQTALGYMQDAGAVWVYNSAKSYITKGDKRISMTGDFSLPTDAVIQSATLAITADDGYGLTLGGTTLALPANHNMEIVNGRPELKATIPSAPYGTYHYQAVNAYDVASLLRAGSNPFTLQIYNSPQKVCVKNVSGVIFRLDVKYRSGASSGGAVQESCTRTGTLPDPNPAPEKDAEIGLCIELLKINGQPVSGQAIVPGDKLTFRLTLANGGDVDARPDTVTLNIPSGLSASKADNPDARLSVSGENLIYTHPSAMIPVGGTDSVEFVLAVRAAATGSHTIRATAEYIYNAAGERVANPTPTADFTVAVTAAANPGKAKLAVAHELIRINDVPVSGGAVVRPGDKLTFRMTMTNQGTYAVRPTTIQVNYSSGLYAQGNDNTNPPWTTYTNSLLYTHDGVLISAGTSRSVEYVLRLRTDASGGQNTDGSAGSVIDEAGKTVPNEGTSAGARFTVTPVGGGSGAGRLEITHQLVKINDMAYRAGDVIRPGDKLTYNMNMKNAGTQAARPETVQVNFTSGLYAQSGDNASPPWTAYTNSLLYTHDGSWIAAGASKDVAYVLRVRADATGPQRVDTNVPTILDPNGAQISNSSPSGSHSFTIGEGTSANPSASSRLDITHTLIRVNDVAVTSSTVIRPGDKLTFTMNMNNTGSVAVKPSQISVNFTSGIVAQNGDNANPPWAAASNALVYTHSGGLIQPGASQSVEYVLRVRADATGSHSVWTDVPTLIDGNGNTVGNGATQKASISIIISTDGSAVQITTKFWLSAVNGTATGIGPDGNMQRINLVPGDVLTFTLRSINSGSQSVAPGEYTVTLPSDQSFSAADNPGWTLQDGVLVYTYGGSLLAPGAQVDALLHLKLSSSAAQGSQTYSYTYNLSKVRLPDGSVVSNNNPATLQVTANVGQFGDMDKTGDSGLGLLPVMFGAMMLLGGGAVLMGTRRRGKRAS